MKVTPLIVQGAFTVAVLTLFLGFKADLWLVGLIGPVWGIVIPLLVVLSIRDPISQQLLLPSVAILVSTALVALSISGRVHQVVGHIALLIYCLLSTLILLGLR